MALILPIAISLVSVGCKTACCARPGLAAPLFHAGSMPRSWEELFRKLTLGRSDESGGEGSAGLAARDDVWFWR